MRMRSGRAALVVALVLLGGCTGQSREHPSPPTSATASADVVVPTEAPPGPTAAPPAAPAPIRAERWYPEGSRLLTLPATDRTGGATFDVAVPGTEYTVHLVCHGGGKIHLWDMPVGADPREPETHPCDGAPVSAVTVLDGPEHRVLEVQTTQPAVARWSLVAVAGLPDGVKIWR